MSRAGSSRFCRVLGLCRVNGETECNDDKERDRERNWWKEEEAEETCRPNE